ncbi:hypothetical protein [Miltoncostaea marina]|uniref:hypothetical protein n=1 Tax=Miltoncostaea marina TaxID=2843215 RepID=UPI001C3CF550|nr:hypothetical protein [Miltoncostaea marina]
MGRLGTAVERRGREGLIGWRARVADAVAGPVSRRTPLREPWLRALVGWTFVVLSVVYLAQFARRMT